MAGKEQEKWEGIYKAMPLVDEDSALRAFNDEFAGHVADLLPGGSKILEAGCGAGWQSLALSRVGKFSVHLADFSPAALNYAQRIFEREGAEATFTQSDMMQPGEADYDLVFNAGVLEHYSFQEQVDIVRGMASRSRKYVLVLVPNAACYWYWMWRINAFANDNWPFGKEVPMVDLSAVFEAAGLHFIGQAYLGASWTEAFIQGLSDLTPVLTKQLLEIHRSKLMIPQEQKAYLIAALGCLTDELGVIPPVWTRSSLSADFQVSEVNSIIADQTSARFAAERKTSQLAHSLGDITGERDQLLAERNQLTVERDQLHAERDRLATDKAVLQDLASSYSERLNQIYATKVWHTALRYWHLRDQAKSTLRNPISAVVSGMRYIYHRAVPLHRRLMLKELRVHQRERASSVLYELTKGPVNLGRRIYHATVPLPMRLRFRMFRQRFGGHGEVRGNSNEVKPLPYYHDFVNQLPRGQKMDIFCFPVIPWDFRFQRPQQLLTQYANDGHRVFYLSTTFTTVSQIQVRRINQNIYELTVPGDPDLIMYRDPLAGGTLRQATNSIQSFIEQQNIQQALCIVYHPFWTPLSQLLKTTYGWKVIYDCIDEHSGFSDNQQIVLKNEERLVEISDLLVTSSQPLFERLSAQHPKTILIRNAGDYDHFRTVLEREAGPLSDLPRPVIGYYGAISEWFDVEAVIAAASIHPDWSFALIGHTFGVELSRLQSSTECSSAWRKTL